MPSQSDLLSIAGCFVLLHKLTCQCLTERYPLEDFVKAFERITDRKVKGKVVLAPRS